MKKNIALTIRGHIRDSLDEQFLYEFLKKITSIHNVDIYIYTFNIKSSGKIYTKENKEINNQNISEKDILNYMKDLSQYIKKLIIDPQNSASGTNDRLIGNISQNKYQHMWKSIFNVINLVKESNINYDFVVNMRIDYFQLINKFNFLNKVSSMQKLFKIDILDFIQKINQSDNISFPNIVECTQIKQNIQNEALKNMKEKKLSCLFKNITYDENDILYGIDNLFAGNLDYLYKLSYIFYNHTNDVFNFLETIMDDLKQFSKWNGGSGGPHEVVLPLFIKNKLNNY
jgi:hypothetical protein